MNKIPFDIPSFRQKEHAASFFWPVKYSEYDFLSYGFIDGALHIRDAQEGDVKIALTCKLSDIIIDLCNVVQQAIGLEKIGDFDHDFIYDKKHSPTCDWLLNSTNPNDYRIVNRLKPRARDTSFKSTLVLQTRKFKRLVHMNKGDDHYNVISLNLLVKEWITAESANTFNLLGEAYLYGQPQNNKTYSHTISNAFQELIFNAYDFMPELKKAVHLAIQMIVENHMSQSMGDLAHLKASKLHKYLRKGLVSGTPKYEGRMLGWYFLEHDKDVIRFAHGGERVFYEDYAWPIAELPFCTHYYAHSQTEAHNMKERLQNNKYACMQAMKHIKFLSRGSLKHQCLYEPSVKPMNNKTLIYVTGTYGHDRTPGLPAFKIPDIIYFEFQIRLLGFLKDQGWHIILKPHPKGIYQDQNYIAPYVDEIVKTPFDANSFKAEIFLFDFAGTAFFDTLATKQRALLLNLGRRPIAPIERANLQKRCSILDLDFDDCGRIALDKTDISAAIESAPQDIDKSFINAYAF